MYCMLYMCVHVCRPNICTYKGQQKTYNERWVSKELVDVKWYGVLLKC